MKLVIAKRDNSQVGFALKFKVLFKCCVCNEEVEPDELRIGRAHVYAVHCGTAQEVGCVA